MIRFSLFGVPVSVHPTLWVTLALLGGALGITGLADLMSVLLFILAGFVCLLMHEMGHALVGRRLGGGHPEVYLAWLGGDCSNEDARLTRMQGVIMTAAGPAASLLLALITVSVLCAYVGNVQLGLLIAINFCLGYMPLEVYEAFPHLPMIFFMYMIEVAVWWTILNLLPIFPLDGGQIMHGLMRSPRQMHAISLAVACVLCAVCLVSGLWLMAIFMVLLACLNHRCRSHAPY